MPIYEYQCTKCSHHLEALQRISDKPLRECPECGRHTLIRLVSAPMFRLAGGGWYETDFKSDQESRRNLADKGDRDAPKSEDKSDAKPETKSEATPETKPETRTEAKPAAAPATETRKRTMVTKPAVKAPTRARAKPAVRKTARPRKR